MKQKKNQQIKKINKESNKQSNNIMHLNKYYLMQLLKCN